MSGRRGNGEVSIHPNEQEQVLIGERRYSGRSYGSWAR